MEITPAKFREPFSLQDFVEKVSRQTSVSFSSNMPDASDLQEDFDPSPLIGEFENTIQDLWALHTHVAAEIEKLESKVKREEESHSQTVAELEKWMTEGFETLKGLGDGVNTVGTKVVHVGDQLEVVKGKRFRAEDASKLMRHFAAFRSPDGPMLPPFDKLDDEDLHEAADIIQKLNFIVLEFDTEQPNNARFAGAKERIQDKFQEIQRLLRTEFRCAYGDKEKMREYAHTLFPFGQAHTECIHDFVRLFIDKEMGSPNQSNLYDLVFELCKKAQAWIEEIFRSPHTVLLTFIQEAVVVIVKQSVSQFLQSSKDYLATLHRNHEKVKELIGKLAEEFDIGIEHMEDKLMASVFGELLDGYLSLEEELLKTSYESILSNFYTGLGHTKRPAKEFKTIPATDETFLSFEVTLSMIHDNQAAMTRCADLAPPANLPDWAYRIFRVLLEGLGLEHVDYAVGIALEHLPPKKPKTEPVINFFAIVQQVNSIMYLLQKHYLYYIHPSVRSSMTVEKTCVNKKNEITERLESQLSTGLERSLDSIVEWLHHLLAKEQKKTDFKPADDAMMQVVNGSSTEACKRCVSFLTKQVANLKNTLNGKNLELVLRNLGEQLYELLLAHVKGLTINTLGGMLLTRDLTEYEKAVSIFEDATLSERFNELRELSAVTIVRVDNLKQLCEEGRMAKMSKEALLAFLQLRSDFKSAKLASYVTK